MFLTKVLLNISGYEGSKRNTWASWTNWAKGKMIREQHVIANKNLTPVRVNICIICCCWFRVFQG